MNNNVWYPGAGPLHSAIIFLSILFNTQPKVPINWEADPSVAPKICTDSEKYCANWNILQCSVMWRNISLSHGGLSCKYAWNPLGTLYMVFGVYLLEVCIVIVVSLNSQGIARGNKLLTSPVCNKTPFTICKILHAVLILSYIHPESYEYNIGHLRWRSRPKTIHCPSRTVRVSPVVNLLRKRFHRLQVVLLGLSWYGSFSLWKVDGWSHLYFGSVLVPSILAISLINATPRNKQHALIFLLPNDIVVT